MYSFPHDNVTVTVHPAQQDRHTVVLINGLFGGGWTWDPVVTALTARGHGAVVT
jgi:pimeloyl-ACP methyl ester carboxylesterase